MTTNKKPYGANQERLAAQAKETKDWIRYGTDRATLLAIDGLARKGLIQTKEPNAFRWKPK